MSAVRSTSPCQRACRTTKIEPLCSSQNRPSESRASRPNCFASSKNALIFSLNASTSTPASLRSRPKTLSPPCRKVKTSSSTRNSKSHFAAARAVCRLNPCRSFTAPAKKDKILLPLVARNRAVATITISFSSCSTPPSFSAIFFSHEVSRCAFPIRKSLMVFIALPILVVMPSMSSAPASQSPH